MVFEHPVTFRFSFVDLFPVRIQVLGSGSAARRGQPSRLR